MKATQPSISETLIAHFLVGEAAVKVWYCHEHHGGRLSDVAIETALMIKGIFGLSVSAL